MTGATRHLLGIALLGIALALPAAQQPRRQNEQKQTEQDLRTLNERIERERRQLARDEAERDRASRQLREAERAVASGSRSLRELGEQRAARAVARRQLIDRRTAKEAERERHRRGLAKQLRSAYFMGHNEPLKLLFNQRKMNEISRNLTYYGYLGRARAAQIAQLGQDVVEIEELTARIEAEDAELARLEQQQKEQLGELNNARQQRGTALASLEKTYRNRSDQLARMQKEKQEFEKKLKELSRATRSTPFDPNTPFGRARDRLAWPVAGRITVDFGKALGGDRRSDGIEIQAPRGAEVRAVYEGRVRYADYWGLRGLMIILDHGNGYWSLYGHNEQLFRQEGERVQAGDLIATVGDSGGRKMPALYFELRSGVTDSSAGKPINPHDWFRAKEPPPR